MAMINAAKSCMIQSTCCNSIVINEQEEEEKQSLLPKIICISECPKYGYRAIVYDPNLFLHDETIQKDKPSMIQGQ